MEKIRYFDHAATTATKEEVLKATNFDFETLKMRIMRLVQNKKSNEK